MGLVQSALSELLGFGLHRRSHPYYRDAADRFANRSGSFSSSNSEVVSYPAKPLGSYHAYCQRRCKIPIFPI